MLVAALLDNLCGAPDRDFPFWNIREDGRARANHGADANGYAWPNEYVGSNPHIGPYLYRASQERHRDSDVVRVVCPRAEVTVLAYDSAIADGHLGHAVAIHVPTDAALRAHD